MWNVPHSGRELSDSHKLATYRSFPSYVSATAGHAQQTSSYPVFLTKGSRVLINSEIVSVVIWVLTVCILMTDLQLLLSKGTYLEGQFHVVCKYTLHTPLTL